MERIFFTVTGQRWKDNLLNVFAITPGTNIFAFDQRHDEIERTIMMSFERTRNAFNKTHSVQLKKQEIQGVQIYYIKASAEAVGGEMIN